MARNSLNSTRAMSSGRSAADQWILIRGSRKGSCPPRCELACARPTVPKDSDEQLVGLHTLRHTYASLLINQGESIKYVSKQLGHASIQITADLYGHLFKETSVSAMNRLSMRIPVAVIGNGTVAVA